jgi:hypothetical protein
MVELGASRLALATVADYLVDPGDYDPDASWQAAMEDLAGDDAAALRALDTQALEWGGWIGTRTYRFVTLDDIDTAVAALDDPAGMARWSYVVRRYPERLEALTGLRDPVFREPLIDRMEARLAVGRAMAWVAQLRSAPPDEQEAILRKLVSLRAEVQGQAEAPRSLDLFFEAAGLALPAPGVDAVAP